MAKILIICGFLLSALLLAAAAILHNRSSLILERIKPITKLRKDKDSEVERQLAQAGFHGENAARTFMLVKLGSTFMAAYLTWALVPNSIAAQGSSIHLSMVITAAALGFYIPARYVDSRRAAFRQRIRKAVPDALDFMQVCIEAGQSIDSAVLRVTDELQMVHPDLAASFRSLAESLAAGATREAAFAQLAETTGDDDLRQFSTIMLQASKRGTPVTQTLLAFTADLRDQRVRQAEAKANVLPTKMTLGSMMFTVPPLLLALLAPAIARITGMF